MRAMAMFCITALTHGATWILIGVTLASLLARHIWWAEILANLRVQWLVATVAIGLLTLAQRRWRLLAVQVILLALLGPWLVWAVDDPGNHGPSANTIQLTVANVLSSNQQHDVIATALAEQNSDVVAVLELSSSLAKKLAQSPFSSAYPHAYTLPMDVSNFGIGLYSKTPLIDAQVQWNGQPRLASLVAQVQIHGQPYQVIAAHTLPPVGSARYEHRNAHLQQLAELVTRLRHQNSQSPVILMGDLNITPWSPIYRDFLATSSLDSAARGRGLTPTWYQYSGQFPFGLILDHILFGDDQCCQTYRVGQNIGSDHRFVTATLGTRPQDSDGR